MMGPQRVLIAVVCLTFLAGGVFAQEEPTTRPASTAPALPQIEPVMDHIPAGAMGFAVVNNIKASADRVEKFLNQVGLAEILKLSEMPGGLIGKLKEVLLLGDGFDPNAGFAAVMLDPQQFGVDLLELMPKLDTMPASASSQPAEKPKVPFILLVPGKGVEEIFSNYAIQPAGPYQEVSLRMGQMFAVKKGGYVALSPSTKALAAMLETTKKASDEMSKSHLEAMSGAGLAVHVNLKIAGPIYAKMLQRTAQTAMPMMGPLGPLMSSFTSFYSNMVTQLDSVTLAARLGETGLVVTEQIDCNPESDWGKLVASYKPGADKLVDRLPNLPYVLACGGVAGEGLDPETRQLCTDMLDKVLASPALESIDEQTKAKIKALCLAFADQVTGYQFVGGGAPKDSGVFGLACVVRCKDAAAVKKMLADTTDILNAVIKALSGESEEAAAFKITYVAGAEKAGELDVDAIDITHPKLEGMEQESRQEMQKTLGEDKIRLRVASADDKTVVVTFGGAQAFMDEALKAAKSGGTILDSEGVADAMKFMPKDCTGLMLFSGGNLADVIVKGSKIMQPEAEAPPLKIESKTPIAIGQAYSGSQIKAVMYLPTSLVKDVVGALKPLFGGMGPEGGMPPSSQPGTPAPGNEDF